MNAPYVYVPFPKWITPPDRAPCIVQSAEEEAALMTPHATPAAAAPPPPAELPPTAEKQSLIAAATSLGVKVDGRWSIERLRTEIGNAPHDMHLPDNTLLA